MLELSTNTQGYAQGMLWKPTRKRRNFLCFTQNDKKTTFTLCKEKKM